MFATLASGRSVGSLSGGCVEEDFLERVADGQFNTGNQLVRYGEGGLAPTLALPCGGVLEVLVEPVEPDMYAIAHLLSVVSALRGKDAITRCIGLGGNTRTLETIDASSGRVTVSDERVCIYVGPSKRLLVAGLSPVAEYCIELGLMLGYEVVVCDPREELIRPATFKWPQLQVLQMLPAVFIENGGCHVATAVVALTHDPRLDDLTMMAALLSDAFYIGAMGSKRTSERRRERIARIGQFSKEQLLRVNAPIGLALGSKTPAEIAMAVMADVIRSGNGVARTEL